MKMVRDIALTLVVLLVLLAGLIALPFIAVAVIILIIGFIVYATLHDMRINQEITDEEEKNTKQ